MKLIFKIGFLVLVGLQSNAQVNSKPNVLWIVTDDQRMDSNQYYNEITTGKKESPLG